MRAESMNNLESWIKKCEGLRLNTYVDTTGNLTVGWGRNLKNGIGLDEAQLMFENDLKQSISELEKYTWFISQNENVQMALINMNFNLGITKLLEFKDMIAALNDKDYTKAAQDALNSRWALQVGQRAKDIALMIRQG